MGSSFSTSLCRHSVSWVFANVLWGRKNYTLCKICGLKTVKEPCLTSLHKHNARGFLKGQFLLQDFSLGNKESNKAIRPDVRTSVPQGTHWQEGSKNYTRMDFIICGIRSILLAWVGKVVCMVGMRYFETSVTDQCYRPVLQTSVTDHCYRPVLQISVTDHCYGPVLQTSVTDQCYRPVLRTSVTDQCYRPLLRTSVTDQCYRPLLWTSVTDQCYRPLLRTSVTDQCYRPVLQTIVTDQCYRPVLQTIVTDQCYRPLLRTSVTDHCFPNHFAPDPF